MELDKIKSKIIIIRGKQIKRPFAFNRIYSRRLFADKNEKTFSNLHS